MNQPDEAANAPYTTRIPADISRPDRLLGPSKPSATRTAASTRS